MNNYEYTTVLVLSAFAMVYRFTCKRTRLDFKNMLATCRKLYGSPIQWKIMRQLNDGGIVND